MRSKVTPRKVGVGLKRRREPSRRRLSWRLAWWGSTEKKREKSAEKVQYRERKVQGQERILAEHLDGLERNDFCDFEKPQKRVYQKGKVESNEQSKEGGQLKSVRGKGRDARQSQKL